MNNKLLKSLLTTSLLAAAGLSFSGAAVAKDRVGVTIYKYDDNFMALFRKDLLSQTSKYPNLDLLLNDSQNSQATQNDQVDTLIARGVKALAINLVDPSAAPTIIKKAKDAGIPVVFFNKDPGQAAINSYSKAYFIGTNPEESGRIQGDLIAEQWKANPSFDKNKDGKLQYVLLKGEPGHPDAEARTKFVVEELKSKGVKLDQLHLDTAMWDTAQAKDKLDAWLSGPNSKKIEVIIANNDAMAFGALEASKAHGVKFPIYGVDALPEALVLIKRGELAGTVLNDAKGQSEAVLAFVNNLVSGKNVAQGTNYKVVNRNYRVPYVGVDAKNVANF